MNAQKIIFESMVGIYDDVSRMVTDKGETIVPEKGHILYSQYTGLYFAELYVNNKFENPYYKDPKTLEMAIKCWEFFYTLTDAEGETKLVTFDNYWGKCVDEWGVFHWMNSLELIKPYMDTDTVQKWSDRIDVIMQKKIIPGVKKQLHSNTFRYSIANHEVANHFCWHVVAAYRYGMLKDDKKAMEIADKVMNLIADGQTLSGTWYEGKTLVSKYATVTIGALSKYYFLSGNEKILNALRKSLTYISKLMYPDFSVSAAIDTRNRYSKHFAPMNFPAAYSYFDEGKEVVSTFVTAIQNILTNKSFIGSTQGIAMLVENYRHIKDDFMVSPVKEFRLYNETVCMPEENVLILKDKKWVVDMCCQTIKTYGSRWILERQNLFAVYNDDCGLIVGGGHSIAQPQLSCFNIVSHGKLYYTHEEGMLSNDNKGMNLTYGNKKCTVRFEFEEESLIIYYNVEGLSETERAYVNIPLFVGLGESVTVNDKKYLFGKEYFGTGVPKDSFVEYKGKKLYLSDEAVFNYPLIPYNSYVVNHQKSFEETFAVITVEFEHNRHDLKVIIK